MSSSASAEVSLVARAAAELAGGVGANPPVRQPAGDRRHEAGNVEKACVYRVGQAALLDEALDHGHDITDSRCRLDVRLVSIHQTFRGGCDPVHSVGLGRRVRDLDQRLIRGQQPAGDLQHFIDGVGRGGTGQRGTRPVRDRESFELAEDSQHGTGERTVRTRHDWPFAAEVSASASNIAMHVIVDSADIGQAIAADAGRAHRRQHHRT
jgi:hypothetical protein